MTAVQVPSPIEYARATSVDHAIALLERLGDEARIVAGGHSLLPMMKLRLANPEYLVDINDLHDELAYVEVGEREVRIGAMTRHRELLESDPLNAVFPIFRDAERVIADVPVRNRGTLGGALCQADPSEDLTSVCTTLDARCVIRSSAGRADGVDGRLPPRPLPDRRRPGRDAHRGADRGAAPRQQRLREGGPAGGGLGGGRGGRRGLAGGRPHRGRPGRPRRRRPQHHRHPRDLAAPCGAVGPTTKHGRWPGEIAARSCTPVTDGRGTVDYKRHLADELTRRTLRTAAQRAAERAAG